MTIIGIDPGASGGIVMFLPSCIVLRKMPEDPNEIVNFLDGIRDGHVFIEKVPKFCGAAQFAQRNILGSAMAVLYGNFRLCVGVCAGLRIPWTEVAPVKWQNLVQCRNTERLERGPWKNKLKARAQGLFPEVRVTLWNSDALLIAHAGKSLLEKV